MTVQTNNNSISYVGNGSTVHFDYDYLILNASHLKVYFGDVLQTSGYVVSGVSSKTGGTVAFAVAPPNGANITLIRDVPFLQLTDYRPYDAFPAESHERALDLLTMMTQQLKDELGRTVQHPVGGNKWDAKGNEIINVGTGSSGTSAANIDQVKHLIASEVGNDPSASASVRSREALRRSYADAGLNLVDGSFEAGGTLVNANDVLLQERTGKAFTGPAGTVAAGTNPASGGFKNRSKVLSKKVNPITRGADETGVAESTAAILLADADAVALGVRLEFTAGTYLVDELVVSSKLVRAAPGHEVILQCKGGGNTKTVLKGSGVDGQTFEGLIADGACSADPVFWSSSNYDSFTGAAGFEIANCKAPRMINCHARNTQRRGLRFVGCLDPLWRDCTQKRARGEFGDGFMAVDCIGTVRDNCHAEDYTRIGHVDDTFGNNPKTSYGIKYVNVTAHNGHDASALYGGTEFNSGVWSENIGSISMTNVAAWDNTHRQVNVCSGVKNNGYTAPTAVFELNNVNTDGGIWGIYTYSLRGLPVTVKKTSCVAVNAARPFDDEARYGEDSFTSVNCHAAYDMAKGGVNARGYTFSTVGALTGRPYFGYVECTVGRVNENIVNLTNTSPDYAAADIGANPSTSSPVRLHIDSMKDIAEGPVYLRINANRAHQVTIDGDTDLAVYHAAMLSGSLTVSPSCSIKSLILTDAQLYLCRLSGCRVIGQVTVTAENVEADSISVDIDNTEYVWLRSNKTGNYPAIDLSNAKLRKDINANGAVLRLGFGAVSFTTILTALRMYNKGEPSASKPFVRYAAGAVRRWSASYADDTVTNITQLDSGGGNETTLAGVTKIAMH